MKIDIVIPWVDGNDKNWLNEKSKFIPSKEDDDSINRYRDWNLLKFWFRGIENCLPWINKIYFVTWGHIPEWLNQENPKLKIIRHEDFIPKECLPTFSSHVIELNMNRINGLSDNFIYFNDDTFVISPMKEADFFINGFPVDTVIEVPFRVHSGGIDHIIANNMMLINRNFNKHSVVKKNYKKWFSLKNKTALIKNLYMLPVESFSAFDNPHLPIAYNKKVLNEVWEKEKDVLELTSKNKFRNIQDVNQWVFRYWQFTTGNFVQGNKSRGKFFSIGKDDEKIKYAFKTKEYPVLCLSDDIVDIDFEKEKLFLEKEFLNIFPNKSSFEK